MADEEPISIPTKVEVDTAEVDLAVAKLDRLIARSEQVARQEKETTPADVRDLAKQRGMAAAQEVAPRSTAAMLAVDQQALNLARIQRRQADQQESAASRMAAAAARQEAQRNAQQARQQAEAQRNTQQAQSIRDRMLAQRVQQATRDQRIADQKYRQSEEGMRKEFDQQYQRQQLFAQWRQEMQGTTTFTRQLGDNLRTSITPGIIMGTVAGRGGVGNYLSNVLLSTMLRTSVRASASTVGMSAGQAASAAETAGTSEGGGFLGSLGGLLGKVPGVGGVGELLGGLGIGGIAALGIGAAVGGYVFDNKKLAELHRYQQSLRAGSSGQTPVGNLFDQTMNAGAKFFVDTATSQGIARDESLGSKVTDDQLRGAVQNSLVLRTLTGRDLSETNPIVGGMTGIGGMTEDQVSRTFQVMNQQFHLTHVSMQRMTDDLKSIQDISGGLAVGARSMTGLAAVQSVIGTANAGQVLSPVYQSTGAQAMALASMLGMSPSAFHRMQTGGGQGPDFNNYYRRVSGVLRQQTAGLPADQRLYGMEQLMGMFFDTSQQSPKQVEQIASAVLSGKDPEAVRKMLDQKQGFLPGKDFRDQISQVAGEQIDDASKIMMGAANKLWDAANRMHDSITYGTSNAAHLTPGVTAANQLPSNVNPAFKQAVMAHGGVPIQRGKIGSTPLYFWPDGTPYDPGRLPEFSGGTGGGGYGPWQTQGPITGVSGPPGGGAPGRAWQAFASGAGQGMNVPAQYHAEYAMLSHQLGIPLPILLSQAAMESGFNPNATSSAGAMGIGQFMPGTFAEYANKLKNVKGSSFYGKTADPYNAQQSIEAQAYYMRDLLAMYHGNMRMALAAYNAGPGNASSPGPWYGKYADPIIAGAARDQVSGVNVTITNRSGYPVGVGSVSTERQKVGAKDHGPSTGRRKGMGR